MAKLAFKLVNFQSSALNNYTALKNNKNHMAYMWNIKNDKMNLLTKQK